MTRIFFSCLFLVAIQLISKGGHIASVQKIVPEYKLATAEKVMVKLIKAFPSHMPNPKLKMTNMIGRVATCSHDGNIIMEERAYNICVGFGPDSLDAMACLLGHELIHYYFGHSGSSLNFVRLSNEKTKSSDTLYSKTIEFESDLKGNLLAAMAGYNSLNIYDQVLEQIYTGYWPKGNKNEGYPTLCERIKGAREKKEEAADLYLAFKMANNLMVVKEFDRALSYYEHIALSYGTAEIFNNIALCYLLRNGFANSIPYKFPFELDAETNLSKVKSRGDNNFDNDIQKAKEALKKALNVNEAYKPALINLACISIIEGNTNRSNYFISELEEMIKGNAPIIESLNGLLQAHVLKDSVKALQFFDEAIAKNDFLAQYNKDVLQKKAKSLDGENVDLSMEKVGGVDLYILPSLPDGKKINQSYLTDSLLVRSHILADYNDKADFFIFNSTKKNTKESTHRGVRVGMNSHEVLTRYGHNYNAIYSGQKRYIAYSHKNKALIFILENDFVQGWIDYVKR